MNDEELRQAMQTLEAYNQQLENINRQARLLQNTRDDAVRATRTVQALIDAKPGDEILIPVGSSCLITVQVSEKKKAIIGIGSKVSVEKELPDAVEYLENTSKELSEAVQKTIAAMQEIQSGEIIRIVFSDNSAFEPVIANLILTFHEPVNILRANTRNVGGVAKGEMVLQFMEYSQNTEAMKHYLEECGLAVEEAPEYAH